jgi:(+)-trans-carveol dehydrogenase
MGRLEGKVALITGGARGQGRSHAVTFAREGADVVVCDVAEQIPGLFYALATEDDLAETQRLVEEAGGRALALRADTRDAAQLDEVVSATVAEFGRIDILCANAGILDLGSWDMTEDQWDLMLDINLKSVWLTCRAAIPTMIAQRGGAIVCTSSLSGLRAFENAMQYGVAKHGVIGLMRHLAVDLAPYDIRVNAVCPAAVDTPMLMNPEMFKKLTGGIPDATLDDARRLTRTQHLLDTPWLESRDISEALLWLVSDEGRYVTGTAVEIDAGALRQPPGIPASA